jgi:hypothetical protein
MRLFKRIAKFLLLIYLVPGLAAAALWTTKPHPKNWREADWTSAHVLPHPKTDPKARITIFAATTGGFKGAFAVQCWIVIKPEGATRYDRYDVVGWGQPVRKNAYEPDGRWYSNTPQVVWELTGDEAEALIPKVEDAIIRYPHNIKGAYKLWPGPNSNTFVASILRAVPEIDAVLPSNAVGRDYLANGAFYSYDPNGDAHLTVFGLFGFSAGVKSGLEMHFLGLVAGVDLRRPGLKIPAFGRFGV